MASSKGGKVDASGEKMISVRLVTEADANAGLGDILDPVRTDPTGTTVQPVSGTVSIAGGSGGTQFADNAASGAAPAGTLAMGWDSSLNKIRAIKVDASQNLLVAIGAAVDVSDRAARLLGVLYGSQGQQLKQTATNFNAQVELAAGATLYDARQIRLLTSTDVVDVFDRAARLLGHVTVDSAAAVDVSDRAARLVGHVTVDSAPTTPVTIAGTVAVSSTQEAAGSLLLETLNNILLELRALRLATVADTCDGGRYKEQDFDPANLSAEIIN